MGYITIYVSVSHLLFFNDVVSRSPRFSECLQMRRYIPPDYPSIPPRETTPKFPFGLIAIILRNHLFRSGDGPNVL